jgi:hypothetical protein
MNRLFFENVRCFFTPQSAPLRNNVSGENSSGKSTLLAMVRLAWDLSRISRPDLNESIPAGHMTVAHRIGRGEEPSSSA